MELFFLPINVMRFRPVDENGLFVIDDKDRYLPEHYIRKFKDNVDWRKVSK